MSEEISASTASGPFAPVSAPIALLAPGSSIGGRYRIDGVIGIGGYGVVYLAFDRELTRRVALKILRPERSSGDGLVRFRREVAIARDIASPRLTRVFDIGTSETAIFLTMEHVEGESLKERLRRGPMSFDEVIATSIAMFEGLEALHAAGVVHRDVKPGNVLLGAGGAVKLADFGLARYGADDSSLTHSGTLLGTSEYIAPEQALGKDIDTRSDLYSGGVVMYEMLTGRTPFEAESPLGVILARLKGPAPDPRKVRRDVPGWLARVVRRLLERKPGDRYRDAPAVLADLRRRRAGFRLRRPAIVLAAALLALGAAGLGIRSELRARRFSHLAIRPAGGVAAVANDGRELWSLPDVRPYPVSFYARARLEKNGERLIVAFLDAEDWKRTREMAVIDPGSGRVVEQIDLPPFEGSFPEESNQFFADSIDAVDLDEDGIDEIIGTFISRGGIASATFIYEPKIRRARYVFLGGGHHRFSRAVDLDGDGAKEIVLLGINNRLGWYNAAAAVRLVPPVQRPGFGIPAVSPDISSGVAMRESLRWYALLPRGTLLLVSPAQTDASSRSLTFPGPGGQIWRLSYDGFPPGAATKPRAAREIARVRGFAAWQEARRLEGAGDRQASVSAIDAAIAAARDALDPSLVEAFERQKARLLVAIGDAGRGNAMFDGLIARSANASEIALQAAHANHLAGRLGDAERWYRRGLSNGSDPAVGLPRTRFLEGLVLVASEEKRWGDALAAVDLFREIYPELGDWISVYREFVYWRRGDRARVDYPSLDVPAETPRYWAVEFMNVDGAPPEALLPKLEPRAWSAEARPVAQSLRAELLLRDGRSGEALEEAKRAALLCEREARQSVFARGHLELVRERLRQITAAVENGTE